MRGPLAYIAPSSGLRPPSPSQTGEKGPHSLVVADKLQNCKLQIANWLCHGLWCLAICSFPFAVFNLQSPSFCFAAEPLVELVTRADETVTGQLTAWTPQALTVDSRNVPSTDLFELRFPDHRVRTVEGDWLVLANGDRVAASVRQVQDDVAEAAWTAAPLRPNWSGPLETVSAFVFNFPAAPRIRRDWLAALEHTPAGHDHLQFITGERLQGEFARLEGQQITLSASFGDTQLDRRRVRWLRFDRDLVTTPGIKGVYWLVWLTDGSRLTATDVRPGENIDVELALAVGGTFHIAWHQLARLQRFDDRLVPLSRRTPTATTYTPYLSGQRTLRRNQNVLGSPIVVRGVESAVGLGMASGMTATYAIEPGDREFRAWVGIDDAAEGQGNARFQVLLDGRLHWESEELTGQSSRVPVPPVPLTGAKTLTLQVDYAQTGDVGDHADWGDAVIVR